MKWAGGYWCGIVFIWLCRSGLCLCCGAGWVLCREVISVVTRVMFIVI